MSNLSFSVETLVPVAISSSPATYLHADKNYVYDADNHEICVLNEQMLQQVIDEKGKRKAYQQLERGANLRTFLKEQLGFSEFDIDEMIQQRLAAHGYRANTITSITRAASAATGEPIGIADHISEAIRAAAVYDWLFSERETSGKEQLDSWVAGIESCYQACRPFFQELRALQQSYRRNPSRLGPHSMDRMKTLEGQLRDQLNTNLKLSDEVLFGAAAAEQVQLTADLKFAASQREIHAIGKIDMDNGDLEQIRLHEAVPQGATSSFEISLSGKFEHPHLSKWNSEPQEELIAMLYNHAYDLIEYERSYIDELIQDHKYGEGDVRLRRNQQENLENLRNLYDNIEENELDQADDKQAFLRLRADGAYLGQTFALALYQADGEAYDRFQTLYSMLPGNASTSATLTDAVLQLGQKRGRRQEAKLNQLLGWVKITA